MNTIAPVEAPDLTLARAPSPRRKPRPHPSLASALDDADNGGIAKVGGVAMLLYVLYACVHFTGKHSPQAGQTQCVESGRFFSAGECRKQLPARPDKPLKIQGGVSWQECAATKADSWIPAAASDAGTRLYKAQASASDAGALAALLAPLTPEARASLRQGLKGRFERTFQGPGSLSFFIVGTGSSVVAYAVANLDDFQYTDMATDVSSAAAAMASSKEDLDLSTIAEDAGVELTYGTETSRRAMPPPGGMRTEP
jgi:hypothetical protein